MSNQRTTVLALSLGLVCIRPVRAQTPTADPLVVKANAQMQANQFADAARSFELLVKRDTTAPASWVRLGIARQLGGDRASALVAYRRAIALGAGPIARYNAGTVFAAQAAPDSAFYWLMSSVGAGFANLQTLTTDHDLDPLHDDRRWTALVDTVKRLATPCMYRPESRAFDFWLGDWDVVTAQGQPAGKSSVQLLLDGCALYENWTTGGNGDGKSLNSYNPDLKMWQQFWTDQTGRVTEYRTSEWVNGSLRYSATTFAPNKQLVHMTFTPIDKDLVRQFGDVSTDNGMTWKPTFDLYYHRRK